MVIKAIPVCSDPMTLGLGNVRAVNIARNEWMEELPEGWDFHQTCDSCCAHVDLLHKNKYELSASDFPNAYIANDCSISLHCFTEWRSLSNNMSSRLWSDL